MTANKQEKANRLLEALVAHLSESLDPDRVDDWLEQELDALLAQADKVRLNEVVTAEQIGITVRKYAVQMELGGGIPELVGEMVDRLYNHGIQAERRVGELVDESTVAALVDKVLEIPLSRRGVGWLSSNPVLLALLAGGAHLGLKTWLHQGIPESLRGLVGRRLPPRWRASLEMRLQEWLLERTAALLSDPWLYSDDNLGELRELVLVAWQDFAERPVTELRELLSSEDIQELFVIGYDFWREFRHSDYFATMLDTGINAFFEKYGDTTLRDLIDEVGIARDDLLDDARRFAPPVLRLLRERGLLDAWLRRHLAPFFEKPETLAILDE
ncbi:MAG: hypothetical protein CL553_15265 [Alcanivorax sp.]|nr:hypothetical protein [Alcanivorax sp.]QVL43097.1 MAG: hypothetical protein KFB92_00365 [Alcanivorax sp.]